MSRKAFVGSTLLLVGVAAALRWTHLGAHELWLDEVFTGLAATSDGWVDLVARDNTPPLYYVLVRAWARLAGGDEVGLRSLSALLGVGFVGVTVWAGATVFDRRSGLWSGTFAAVASLHVYYSQEARNYAFLLFLTAVAYGLTGRVVAGAGARTRVALGVAFAALFYTHYFGVLVVGSVLLGLGLASILDARFRAPFLATSGSALAAVVAFVPWLVWAFVLTEHSAGELSWIEQRWDAVPFAWKLPTSLQVLLLGPQPGQIPLYLRGLTVTGIPEWLYGAATLAWAGTVVLALAAGDERFGHARRVAVVTWATMPLVGLLAASALIRPLYVIGRYDLLALPALVMVAGHAASRVVGPIGPWSPAAGWSAVGRLAVGATLVGCILTAMFLSSVRYLGHEPKRPVEAIAEKLDGWIEPGDGLILSGSVGVRVGYQLQMRGLRRSEGRCRDAERDVPCPFFPPSLERTPASEQRYLDLNAGTVEEDLTFVEDTLRTVDDAWLVSTSVRLTRQGVRLDRAETALVGRITEAGYRMVAIDPGARVLHFARPTGRVSGR